VQMSLVMPVLYVYKLLLNHRLFSVARASLGMLEGIFDLVPEAVWRFGCFQLLSFVELIGARLISVYKFRFVIRIVIPLITSIIGEKGLRYSMPIFADFVH
jgi:hypothetical protein